MCTTRPSGDAGPSGVCGGAIAPHGCATSACASEGTPEAPPSHRTTLHSTSALLSPPTLRFASATAEQGTLPSTSRDALDVRHASIDTRQLHLSHNASSLTRLDSEGGHHATSLTRLDSEGSAHLLDADSMPPRRLTKPPVRRMTLDTGAEPGQVETSTLDGDDEDGPPALRASNGAVFAAGAFAGVVSRTSTAPLDRLKMLMQVGTKWAPVRPVGVLAGLRAIHAQGGFVSFFQGNTANVIKVMPENGVKFWCEAAHARSRQPRQPRRSLPRPHRPACAAALTRRPSSPPARHPVWTQDV
jgi:hypothetical protein